MRRSSRQQISHSNVSLPFFAFFTRFSCSFETLPRKPEEKFVVRAFSTDRFAYVESSLHSWRIAIRHKTLHRACAEWRKEIYCFSLTSWSTAFESVRPHWKVLREEKSNEREKTQRRPSLTDQVERFANRTALEKGVRSQTHLIF